MRLLDGVSQPLLRPQPLDDEPPDRLRLGRKIGVRLTLERQPAVTLALKARAGQADACRGRRADRGPRNQLTAALGVEDPVSGGCRCCKRAGVVVETGREWDSRSRWNAVTRELMRETDHHAAQRMSGNLAVIALGSGSVRCFGHFRQAVAHQSHALTPVRDQRFTALIAGLA